MGAPKVEHETRFYITSLVGSAQLLGPIVRSHWAVENSLHWVLDMTFRDDECRIRTQHAPANFITVKHMAHNLIRRARGKNSLRLGAKSPPGATTSSQAYCSVHSFARFPCPTLRPRGRGLFDARALESLRLSHEKEERLAPPWAPSLIGRT